MYNTDLAASSGDALEPDTSINTNANTIISNAKHSAITTMDNVNKILSQRLLMPFCLPPLY